VFNDLPGWVVPLVSSVLTGVGTLLAAVLSYRNQSKKIEIEYNDSNSRLKEIDLAEIKAIADGNRALREALIERVEAYERSFTVMREAHQDCERRLESIEVDLRKAKRRLQHLESTVDEQKPDKDSRP
jgi:phage shock protein A